MQDVENNTGEQEENNSIEENADIKAENEGQTVENSSGDDLQQKLTEANDKYLRLYSEFDNYRRRTMKERAELIRTASEDVLKAMLPVIDDFERALKANESAQDANALSEGVSLIYNKLRNIAQQKGLTPFESSGQEFNPDLMEAITHTPAPDEKMKGKVVDEIEKGYKIGDKVIRYAKVVVGQ
jgi:molecular chaperone GrpE